MDLRRCNNHHHSHDHHPQSRHSNNTSSSSILYPFSHPRPERYPTTSQYHHPPSTQFSDGPNFYPNLPPPPPHSDFHLPPPPPPSQRPLPPSRNSNFNFNSTYSFRSPDYRNPPPPVEYAPNFRAFGDSRFSSDFSFSDQRRDECEPPIPRIFNCGPDFDPKPSMSSRRMDDVGCKFRQQEHRPHGMIDRRPTARFDDVDDDDMPGRRYYEDIERRSYDSRNYADSRSYAGENSREADRRRRRRRLNYKKQHLDAAPSSSLSGRRSGEFITDAGGVRGSGSRKRGSPEYSSPGNNQERVQKKSAFDRIQIGNSSNNAEVKSKTSPYKGKYSSPAKSRITKILEYKEGQGGPVDVSFKSNSLVAKQSASPSSPIVSLGRNSTPRNRMSKKPTSLEMMGSSSLTLDKANEDPTKWVTPNNISESFNYNDKRAEQSVRPESDSVCETPCHIDSIDGRTPARTEKFKMVINGSKSRVIPWKRMKFSDPEEPFSGTNSRNDLSEKVVPSNPISEISYKDPEASFRYSPSGLSTKYDSGFNSVTCSTASDFFSLDDPRNHPAKDSEVTDSVKALSDVSVPKSDKFLTNKGNANVGYISLAVDCTSQFDHEQSYQENSANKDDIYEVAVSNNKQSCVQESRLLKEDIYEGARREFSTLPEDKYVETADSYNSIVDQSCPVIAPENGHIKEHLTTVSIDGNNNFDHVNGLYLADVTRIEQRNLYEMEIDSGKGNNSSLNQIEKERSPPSPSSSDSSLMPEMDKGSSPEEVASSDHQNTTMELVEDSLFSMHDVGNGMVPPGSYGAMVSHGDGVHDDNPKLLPEGSESSSGNEVSAINELENSHPNILSGVTSSEIMLIGQTAEKSSSSSLFGEKNNVMAYQDDQKHEDISVVRSSLDDAQQAKSLPLGKAVTPAQVSSVSPLPSRNFICTTSHKLTNHRSHAVPGPYRKSSTVYFPNPKQASGTRPVMSRTWCRSNSDSVTPLTGKGSVSNLVPPISQLSKVGNPQSTSYIRLGNSLVRNPSPVVTVSRGSRHPTSVGRMLSYRRSDEKESALCENNDDLGMKSNSSTKSENRVGIQKSETCLLQENTASGSSDNAQADCPDFLPIRQLVSCQSDSSPDTMNSPENGTLDDQGPPIHIIGNQTTHDIRMKISSKSEQYSKNELITASAPNSISVVNVQKTHTLPSGGYYKTRMNQIIRTPLEDTQLVSVSGSSSREEGLQTQNTASTTSIRQAYKGTLHKPANSSLVWTLQGAQPVSKIAGSLVQRKKSATWRNVLNLAGSSNRKFSFMTRKLALYRSQNTLYKRSIHGLSLKKYKVLGLPGGSLKWSKSIESRSKKASEEATLAVIAAEMKKREQGHLKRLVSRGKNKHHSASKSAHCELPRPGGPIFHIGSARYRMDASGRTLRRVTDDASHPATLQNEDAKRVYVPRRLVIGKDDYIRIGNGNQLVRDPKKRARLLASEKIRLSLLNVRSRAAKKNMFCQFYTRFGKCNKDEGKCPFIHDQSKIAVCTKFLNGVCSDHDCKLTHKVIPERMEDCSFFLQGTCSNDSCPYRHVNVNPNASTCEGFLKGYCADEDECKKKHSYVCQVFEATGSCPQGSKCKLHHPTKKRKATSRTYNSSQGRYFGLHTMEFPDTGTTFSLRSPTSNSGNIFQDGDIPEFISLDVSGGDGMDNFITEISLRSTNIDHDAIGMEFCDLDTLVKPIKIMRNCV